MSAQVTPYTLAFPDGFDERAQLEAPCKGYLGDVEVQLEDGRRYRLYFIDPVRLGQDLEDDVRADHPYRAEPNMVVVPEVTLAAVQTAVAGLVHEGYFDRLGPAS